MQEKEKLALENGPEHVPMARVPKGLKFHRFHTQYESQRWIVRQMGFNGMLSLCLGVGLNELKWSVYDTIPPRTASEGPVYSPANQSTTVEVFKWIVSINVMMLLLNLYRFYAITLEIGKASGVLLPQDTFYSAGLLGSYVAEFIILMIHSIPGVEFNIQVLPLFPI